MIINKNGLITENPINVIEKTVSDENSKLFNSLPVKDDNDTVIQSPNLIINSDSNNIVVIDDEKIRSLQNNKEKTVETNCLALTVRKNYNLAIVKNSIFTTLRLSWKVALSTFLLNVLKLFF